MGNEGKENNMIQKENLEKALNLNKELEDKC